MKWTRSGLFLKFLTVMGGLAVIPVTYLAFNLTDISQKGIQAAVLELHTKLAEKLADQADDYFKVTDDKLSFALASLQKNMAWAEKQELLRSLIDTYSDIIEISILNSRGQELLKVYNPELSTQSRLISRAQEEGFKRFISSRTRTMAVTRKSLQIYYPLNKSVLARIEVSLRGIDSRIANERVGGTGFAILVDKKGDPLFFSEERLPAAEVGAVARWPIVTAALGSQSIGSSEFTGPLGQSWVGAYAPVSALAGAVIILQLQDEAYLAARQMRRSSVFILLLVLCVSFLAATVMARKLAAPLLALTQSAEAVSRGDFSSRVDIATGDELQDLSETFNRMTNQLRSYSELQVDRLIAEQRKTGAILFSIDEGILMRDKEGVIQLANRRALEFLDLESSFSIEGKTITQAIPDSKLRSAMLHSASGGKPGAFEEVNLADEKVHKYVRVTTYPVISPGTGAMLGTVTALRDVTLEKELEKIKEEFLHYITHDLRNPLGSAMGFVEVLLKGLVGVLNPEQHNMVSSIHRSTNRLMGMINNILDIAKMESGRIRLNLQRVSLSGIACRSMSILESLSQQKKLKVVFKAAEEYSLVADSDLMERVFTNLIGNAIKYTPIGGDITISIVDQGDFLRGCVEDNGDGIPEDYLDRIFEKFEQVTGQRRGGTGLGLTITKYFIEAHLGKIWVESEVGKGSQFFFIIPKNLALDEVGNIFIREAAQEARF